MNRAPWGKRLLWLAGVVTTISIVAGLFLIDSPAEQRRLRLDAARITDLQMLRDLVRHHWREQAVLPADLDVLAAQPGATVPRKDPGGGPAYLYKPLEAPHFELCTTFDTDSAISARSRRTFDIWTHPAGPHCFRLNAGDRD